MRSSESGFSLAETLVAIAIMMVVSATVTSALMQMSKSQATIWNRTEMHSGVRSATELLQQEVGQAGRITLPTTITLNGAVALATRTLTLSAANGGNPTTGIYVGEYLTIDTGSMANCVVNCPETVEVKGVDAGANQITVDNVLASSLGQMNPGVVSAHATAAPVTVYGGFASGIVPTNYATSPSRGDILKLYGDINGDGNMVYVEYTCDTANGYLYRNMMSFDAANKPPIGAAQVLLGNIQANPGGTDCFTYQQMTVSGNTYVTDVAITLTVQTQQKDPITNQYQTETKALLNVSPRNVFNVWQLASSGGTDHIQRMPPSVTNLLQ
jgi:type II secretory pathway pseudopilin PulG